jgi:hypothetical protein
VNVFRFLSIAIPAAVSKAYFSKNRLLRILLFLAALLTFQVAFAQTPITGKVIQKDTKEPVPYATIGLAKKNTGTNANERGEFSFDVGTGVAGDTIIISSVGYETVRTPFENITVPFDIGLEKKFQNLPDVIVKDNWRSTILNDSKGCGDFPVVSTGYHTQLAQPFEFPVAEVFLKSVEVCMGSAKHTSTPFLYRIRIYGLDTLTGGPGEDLVNEAIELRSKGKIQKIDLSGYHIKVPGKKFFVALEWIIIPSNEYGSSGEEKLHGPGMGTFKKDKGGTVWSQYYNGRWSEDIFYGRTTISATVIY